MKKLKLLIGNKKFWKQVIKNYVQFFIINKLLKKFNY